MIDRNRDSVSLKMVHWICVFGACATFLRGSAISGRVGNALRDGMLPPCAFKFACTYAIFSDTIKAAQDRTPRLLSEVLSVTLEQKKKIVFRLSMCGAMYGERSFAFKNYSMLPVRYYTRLLYRTYIETAAFSESIYNPGWASFSAQTRRGHWQTQFISLVTTRHQHNTTRHNTRVTTKNGRVRLPE